tara:strand:- start:229 stop:696 length:468 start_codon:yes stop_codon:yes gene_type:complete
MARRKVKSKPRRKTQKKINLLGVAESVLIANVVTEGLFNCNAYEFISGRTQPKGFKVGYHPSNLDSVITLPELLGFDQNLSSFSPQNPKPAPNYKVFTSAGAMNVIKANAKANAVTMVGGLILVPLGFRVANKLTSKPRASMNKMIGYTGLGVKV